MEQREKLNPSFSWLNTTQFMGAMNDNIFKLLVTFFLIRNLGEAHADRLTAIGGILFALPFLLLTPAGGILADRHSKQRITLITRIAEIVIMVIACGVFLSGSTIGAFAVLFLMSAQSAFFGPSKYGLIPELVKPHQLSKANSYLVLMTYLAIIAGTILGPGLTDWIVGPIAADNRGDLFAIAGLACVVIAIAGTFASSRIEPTPAQGNASRISLFFIRDVWRTFRSIRDDRFLVLATIAAAYFSLLGAFIQMNMIPFAIEHLELSETAGGYLFIYAALGIGLGSWLAGRLSGRNIEFGAIPIGAILIAASLLALWGLPHDPRWTRVWMLTVGVGAGIYLIPIEAFIQFRAPRNRVGEVLAASSFLSWIGILGAAFLIFGLSFVPQWTPAQTFLLLGLITLGLTVATLILLPDFLTRFLIMVLTRSVYRIRTIDLDNLPDEGGALLVSNHVSYLDALHILSVQQRRIRFLMERSIYEGHTLRPLFRLMGVIPISRTDPPRTLIETFQRARTEMEAGYLVCIFAEGALTRTGQMTDFKPGMEKILKGTDFPVIPIYIGGTWGSRFSHYHHGRSKPPIRWRYPVTLVFGQPMPATTKAWQARQAVMELSTRYYESLNGPHRSVARAFIRNARKHGAKLQMTDTTGKELTVARALIGALILARKLKLETVGETHIGLLLPTSVGGALANLALPLLGKVSVNLNFTSSTQALESAMEQADITTVITSKKFLARFPDLPLPANVIYLEKVMESVSGLDRIRALLAAKLLPTGCLAPALPDGGDTPATILFSSGTTGDPKGVVLSHHNLISNVESVAQVFRPHPGMHLCATLPLFHSFGLTAGIFLPVIEGLSVHYHTSPRDADQVLQVLRERNCTAIFSTPSFLMHYRRRGEPADFASLEYIVAGAEKLPLPLADAYEAEFGIRPSEGYGCTEMSPVVALSLPGVNVDGVYQAGSKNGSVGQPLPGVAARVVNPETRELLEPGMEGLLEVRGPNQMLGYLHHPEWTEEVIRDGWYITGDITMMDEEGFIFIRDRLLRFSKIGGEMVPHLAIEEYIHKELNATDRVVAVTSVRDERKGEKLVLLFTEEAGDAGSLGQLIQRSELPNLWKPHRNMLFPIETVPLTSSGKVDLKQLKIIARGYVGD